MTAEQVAAARAAAPQRGGSKKRGRSGGDGKRTHSAETVKSAGLGTCPVCKQGGIIENTKAFGCDRWRDGCGFTIWKTIAGHRLSEHEVAQLIEQGATDQIDGFSSKAGVPFSARLRLDDRGKVALDFTQSSSDAEARSNYNAEPRPADAHDRSIAESLRKDPLVCPQCGQGRIIEGRQAFGCNRWRQGCDYRVAKEAHGRALTEAELRALVARHRREDQPSAD